MHVIAIMATCGRHKLAERSLRFFMDQDYKDKHTLLIFNNSPINQRMGTIEEEGTDHKTIILVNQHIDSQTGGLYSSLGGVYNDALKHVPGDADVITHFDDDDIFLPNHISEGVSGLTRVQMCDIDKPPVGYIAYKPERSYYRHPKGVELMGNNLEPSVFVEANHIRDYGYSLTTSDQHMTWFNPLLSEHKMFVDPHGIPTLIYNWGDTDIPTFKTSGNAGDPKNFDNYRNFSQDHGDLILTPWSKEDVLKYYNLVKSNG